MDVSSTHLLEVLLPLGLDVGHLGAEEVRLLREIVHLRLELSLLLLKRFTRTLLRPTPHLMLLDLVDELLALRLIIAKQLVEV